MQIIFFFVEYVVFLDRLLSHYIKTPYETIRIAVVFLRAN